MDNVTLYILGTAVLLTLFLWAWLRYTRRSRRAPTPFSDLPLREMTVDGWTWRYHTSGTGPHMVLLHGIGANLFCWRFIIPYLARHYTIVAPDLPGFGQNSKPGKDKFGLDEQVERLGRFFTKVGIRKTYLVGNSMGGNIAMWFALHRPDQVLGTVVIAPAASPSLIPSFAAQWTWAAKPLSRLVTRGALHWAHRRTVSKKYLVGPDRIEETFKTYGRNPEAIRNFLLATESITDPRLGQSLSQLKSRVLILWGSRDRLVSRRIIDDLEAKLDDHESHVHVGGGHHLQEDEPQWVSEKIDAFVAEARSNLH